MSQSLLSKVVPFSSATKIVTPEATIWDYAIAKDVGISYQNLKGRGPQTGQYLNTVCHELYFIIKGEAIFYINGVEHLVAAKDVVVVEPNTSHYIEVKDGTDQLEYITITRPDWYAEQYKQVT